VTNEREQLFPADWQDAARYAAPYSFMRLPLSRELRYADVAIVGVPFDLGVNMRPGARFGPRGIRNGSFQIRQYPMKAEDLWGPFRSLRVVDYGDLNLVNAYIDTAVQQIEEQMAPVFEAGVIPISLGGDHTITLPILRACAKRHGPVALVHFDAHLDTWDTYFGAEYTHGTPFRRAVEEGILDTEALCHVGTRGPLYGKKDLEDDRRFGFGIVTSSDVFRQGVDEVVEKIRQRVGNRPVYVSVDIDVLDPAHAPGTGTPEAGGLTSRELLEILRGFAGLNLIGADVVEVAPAYDHAQLTGVAASHVAYDLVSLLAMRHSGQA